MVSTCSDVLLKCRPGSCIQNGIKHCFRRKSARTWQSLKLPSHPTRRDLEHGITLFHKLPLSRCLALIKLLEVTEQDNVNWNLEKAVKVD